MHILMVDVFRAGRLESRHLGSLAVCDPSGRLVAWAGDPETITFWRSSMKPVQALAFAESGALEAFGLGEEALAQACASHNGEARHVATVDAMLKAGRLRPGQLGCGIHPPRAEDYEAMLLKGRRPDQRHSNCSGKHAGMLLACKHRGYPLGSYLDPAHPHQRRIRAFVARMTGAAEKGLVPGVDGCSAPIYALSLVRMATAYARLVNPPEDLKKPCDRITAAMTAHPFLIGGTHSFDTDLMTVAGDRFMAKGGAEGLSCIGLRKKGWGFALKIADGAARATAPAALEALRQLGAVTKKDLEALARHAWPPVKNVRGMVVGEIRPARFEVRRAKP